MRIPPTPRSSGGGRPGSGPGALRAHASTRGPPRAGRVPIGPLSWEFSLKAKQTGEGLVLPVLYGCQAGVARLPGPLLVGDPPPRRCSGPLRGSGVPCSSPRAGRLSPQQSGRGCGSVLWAGAEGPPGAGEASRLPSACAPHGTQTRQEPCHLPGAGCRRRVPGRRTRREQRPSHRAPVPWKEEKAHRTPDHKAPPSPRLRGPRGAGPAACSAVSALPNADGAPAGSRAPGLPGTEIRSAGSFSD